jgi:excisionase family DNA binding protein
MRPLLVTVYDAAHLLGVSHRTITRLITQGCLPSVKVRRRRMLKMSGLIEFAEKGNSVQVLQRVLSSVGGSSHGK